MESVLVYKREPKSLFHNTTQLVFGGGVDPTDLAHGQVHYPDLPMIGTLLDREPAHGPLRRLVARVGLAARHLPGSRSDRRRHRHGGADRQPDGLSEPHQLGRVPLASDGSVHVRLPALTPVIVELQDGSGNKLFTMSEEDQLGPGEHISRGVPQVFFNSVCAGCHGSVSGKELDIALDPDALTGASVSLSRDTAQPIGP